MTAQLSPEVFSVTQLVPSKLKLCIEVAIKAHRMIMITGAPGIGKSAIIKMIAKEYNLLVIDFRLAQCDPTDVNGFPFADAKAKKAGYLPMDTFPLEGEELPINPETGKPYQGWLLFLDEFNSADRAVQKAAYKVCLDRKIGKFNLHERCVVVGAGNRMIDNAIVEELSSALVSRMSHLELISCPPEWLNWAESANIDYRITSYIRDQPEQLNTFNPAVNNELPMYACERTWEFTHDYLQHMELEDSIALPMLAGTLSEGVARDFINWVAVYKNLAKFEEICAEPYMCKLPDSPGKNFAMTGMLAGRVDKNTIQPVVNYIDRLPKEFQVVGMRSIGLRKPDLVTETPFVQWTLKNGQELF